MRKVWGLPAALVFLTTLTACGSSHQAKPYSGRLYSVGQVQRAFAQLGFALHREAGQKPGVVVLRLDVRVPGEGAAAGLGSVTVATRRASAGTSLSLPGRVTKYANVTAFSKSYVLDEVRGAMSALRWGTLSQGKPGKELIVLGKSLGPVWLGESKNRVERLFGPGRSAGRGIVKYFGGHLFVDYEFHDRVYNRVMILWTRWSGFRTRSGVQVGSTRNELRPLYATCESETVCYLEQGPWPDALATGFTLKDGKVAVIDMGPS